MAARTQRPTSRKRRAERIEPSKLLSSVDIIPQRVLPIANVLLLEVLTAAGVIGSLLLGARFWIGGLIGLALALLLVVRLRGTTLPGAIRTRIGYFLARRSKNRRLLPPDPFDIPLDDGAQIGFRWDGESLMSLLRIEENRQALTILEPGATVSGETVSAALLVECLQQFDIDIDSIDVISQGARSSGHTRIADVYDAVLGPLPAIAERSVWVAIRFDPSRCADAVRQRGGGRTGILRTATTATRRVANRLTEAGLRPHILTATEIAQATNQLADGVSLGNLEEHWTTCQEGNFRLQCFALTGSSLTTAGLGLVWTIPSYSTTVCVSLHRMPHEDLISIRGLVRFDTYWPSRITMPGLRHLRAQQYDALVSTLPLPYPNRPLGQWVYGRDIEDFRNLALPASGCGQLIGADEFGRAVALPVFGPQIGRVEIAGTLHLAQQVVLRALALGARILVHTRRPGGWRGIVEAVADQSLLWVADFNRGSMQAGAERNFSVSVFDGVAEQSVRAGITKIVVMAPNTVPSDDTDVSLEQIDQHGDQVRVSTKAGSAVVTIVATDEEMQYLKGSFEREHV